MREHPFWQGHTGRHQEGRPIDGVEADNVFANYMQGRPIGPARAIRVRIACGGDVIGQRVHPYIHDMAVIAGDFDAPVKGRARNRQVAQAGFHKTRHLVAPLGGCDKIRI